MSQLMFNLISKLFRILVGYFAVGVWKLLFLDIDVLVTNDDAWTNRDGFPAVGVRIDKDGFPEVEVCIDFCGNKAGFPAVGIPNSEL